MFIFRSVFWLGLAFVVIQPLSLDFAARAGANQVDHAVTASQQAVGHQLANIPCTTFECAGSKVVLAATGITNNPSVASTMQDSPSQNLAPVPRPRLVRAG